MALLAPAAWAQTPPPDGDVPPVLTEEDYPPLAGEDDDLPAASAPPQALTETETETQPESQLPPPQGAPVEVGVLGTTEGPPVGLLDSANGGLGESLWSGSKRAEIEELLTRIPLVSPDPAIRALAKRIVLTIAAAPPGPSKRALVAVRIEKLLDAGLIDEAGALAAQASVPNDPDFARVQAEALLTASRAADVCGEATATRLTAGEPFWLQLRAYCAAAGGDRPLADLTLAVLEAQGSSDKAYNTLIDDVLNHKSNPPGPIAHPSAMHLFLLRQAGLPVPGEVASVMGTPANLLAMRDARNSPPVRFAAAERIVRTGATSVTELRMLADAQDIPLSRLANAIADAQAAPFFAGQVLLRRAAVIEPRPDAKAQLVFEALTLGARAGLLPLAAGLQGDIAATVKPDPANRAMADLFARALLLARLPDAAARWLSDKDVLFTAVDLAAPNPVRNAKAQAAFSTMAAALIKDPPGQDPDKPAKALLLGIADVLGHPLPPDAKAHAPGIEAMDWGGKRLDPAIMQRIESAALHPDRKGEALLLILDTIRSVGLRDLAPKDTIELIRLLGAMGLADAAHDIGIEALALYVPPPPAPPK
ncbi:MAG TPA: hypothetical protein VGC27_10285 [Rhizomicrobium sp.]